MSERRVLELQEVLEEKEERVRELSKELFARTLAIECAEALGRS